MTNLKEANLLLTNIEAIQNILKDRTWYQEFLNKLNDRTSKIESYIKCLRQETIDRAQLINVLEVATSYYEEQNSKFQTVSQVYFNYTKSVELLKSKLQSLVSSMPTDSSMHSTDINATSPVTSSVPIEDLNIHNINYDTVLNSDKYNMMNSSMDNSINDTDIYVPTTVINNVPQENILLNNSDDEEDFDVPQENVQLIISDGEDEIDVGHTDVVSSHWL
eukprot:XP_016658878.1 PREDICTED: uncharacterized protein LOC107883417 isoform X2 [Acyrthosiphon pisum]